MGTSAFENDWTCLSEQEKRRWAFQIMDFSKEKAADLVNWIEEAEQGTGIRRWFDTSPSGWGPSGWTFVREDKEKHRMLWEKD